MEKIALSIEEASNAGGPGKTKIYDAINAGELRAFKNGRATFILVDDFRAWLESMPRMGARGTPKVPPPPRRPSKSARNAPASVASCE